MYTGETAKQMVDGKIPPNPSPNQEPRLQRILSIVDKNAGDAEMIIQSLRNKLNQIHLSDGILDPTDGSKPPVPPDALSELERQLQRIFNVINTMDALNRHLSQII